MYTQFARKNQKSKIMQPTILCCVMANIHRDEIQIRLLNNN